MEMATKAFLGIYLAVCIWIGSEVGQARYNSKVQRIADEKNISMYKAEQEAGKLNDYKLRGAAVGEGVGGLSALLAGLAIRKLAKKEEED